MVTSLLQDEKTLRILIEVCRGTGVSVNLSYLSRKLGRHRNTIKKRIDKLFEHRIINPPVYPFFGIYRHYPLLILVFADFPHTKKIVNWMKQDEHIFAAFKIRRGQYNTLLVLFHKNILNYYLWREHLTESGKIPSRYDRTPSEAHFYPNQMVVEYSPNSAFKLVRNHVDTHGTISLRGHTLDVLDVQILEQVLEGKGISVNEHHIAKKLHLHRNTLRRRIAALIKERILLKPVCRFPSFFVPPDCVLQITRVEINKDRDEILKYIKRDPHIPMAWRICEERYNHLLFEVFLELEEHVEWSSRLRDKFRGVIGMTDTTVLMEKNAFNIDQQKVSLGAINSHLRALKGEKADYFSGVDSDLLLFSDD